MLVGPREASIRLLFRTCPLLFNYDDVDRSGVYIMNGAGFARPRGCK